MMIVRLLGLLDLATAVALILLHYGLAAKPLAIIFASYMLFKGFAFLGDFASIIDLVVGLYILAAVLFGLHTFVAFILAFYLLQKAAFSFF